MKFIYQARDQKGELKKGFVVAENSAKAEQLLANNGLIIINMQAQQESFFSRFESLFHRVSYKDLVIFSRQLATLVAARVPILQGLRILQDQVSSKGLVIIIQNLINGIEGGQSLSLAMSRHPDVFGNVYISLVKSGEAAGTVAESLNYLADQLEKDYDLRSKVKAAVTYPGFVLSALLVVGVLMFKFVLPSLVEVLKEQEADLPIISKWLIAFTGFFEIYWWIIILIFIGAIVLLRWYISSRSGRFLWDSLKIRLPVLGPVLQKIYMARFARNLATLVAGGIPIIQALKIVADVINNSVYREIMLLTAEQVTNGKSISESLAKYREFPPMVTQMVRVGEQTAELDTILGKLAGFYEREVDAQISTLSSLLEPVIMLILGCAVGLLVAGVLLPIYNLASSVS
ncbi:MAG TPA: type II secretion system F family protein [Candidatus Doudnabacteria bacterium]|nr:type II secretion system F family protein [Candidatus Doudnabacteria bacterium]